MSPVEQELKERLAELGPDEKHRLLEYVRTLGAARKRGVPGPGLLALYGSLSEEDAREMLQVIEDSFERVDPNAW